MAVTRGPLLHPPQGAGESWGPGGPGSPGARAVSCLSPALPGLALPGLALPAGSLLPATWHRAWSRGCWAGARALCPRPGPGRLLGLQPVPQASLRTGPASPAQQTVPLPCLRAGVCNSQAGYAVGAKARFSGEKSKYRVGDCSCFECAVGSGVVPGSWCYAGVSRGALPVETRALSPRLVCGVELSFGRCDKITFPFPERLLPVGRPPVRLRGTACGRCPLDVCRCRVGDPLPLGAKLPSPLPAASRRLCCHGRWRAGRVESRELPRS